MALATSSSTVVASPSFPYAVAVVPHLHPFPVIDSSPGTKQSPLPWTQKETTHLIQAYQEKWYSLNRGPLRANQWEEVSIAVAALCGYDEQSKTATQCRHKIEKLRKRYRSEKQRPAPSMWQFFDSMDAMERGPLPISARPVSVAKLPIPEEDDEDDSYDSNGYSGVHWNRNSRSRSINYIVRDSSMSEDVKRPNTLSRQFMEKHGKMREVEEEEREDEYSIEEDERGGNKGSFFELAATIKAFSQRLVQMETKKMEMMRETEKRRMEMEKKRMEMIVKSQRMIVDTISKALGSCKRLKVTEESHCRSRSQARLVFRALSLTGYTMRDARLLDSAVLARLPMLFVSMSFSVILAFAASRLFIHPTLFPLSCIAHLVNLANM